LKRCFIIKIFFFSLFLIITAKSQVTLIPAFKNLTFNNPVFLTYPADGTNRLFVVEQRGIIKVFINDSNTAICDTFLNVSGKIINSYEQGLLGLAFHPDFVLNKYFYIFYTRAVDGALVVSRFNILAGIPNKADTSSQLILLTIDHSCSIIHNSGCLMFGSDGYLYIGTGDGGPAGDTESHAQNVNLLLGKVLRIDVNKSSGNNNYDIPPGNPFAVSGGKPEIFCWGLRNPWRFSQDPVTHNIFVGDVGQGSWEEINIINAGKNYGWHCYEGTHYYPNSDCNYTDNFIAPVTQYYHYNGECAVTGGYVYRGSRIPCLNGKYLFGDYCTGKIWQLQRNSDGNYYSSIVGRAPSYILAFGIDKDNELYVLCGNRKIYRINDYYSIGNCENDIITSEYFLEQNYPNPFNSNTLIKYQIPVESFVKLNIYNLLGEHISTLVNENKNAGQFEILWDAKELPSGVYCSVLETNGGIKIVKKMVLVK